MVKPQLKLIVMEKSTIKLPDELIEKWGEFYTSEYVKNHRPDVYELEFIEFIQKQAIRYGYAVS
ncbi:hypothetical protein ACSU6B_23375 [Neobacillus sp. C211]|uniref:hypothetical protein n=1 Tax=unclassified Neobacillus TaxID=2675272 RepID=UPI0039785D44